VHPVLVQHGLLACLLVSALLTVHTELIVCCNELTPFSNVVATQGSGDSEAIEQLSTAILCLRADDPLYSREDLYDEAIADGRFGAAAKLKLEIDQVWLRIAQSFCCIHTVKPRIVAIEHMLNTDFCILRPHAYR
jgi:hypothetical protein